MEAVGGAINDMRHRSGISSIKWRAHAQCVVCAELVGAVKQRKIETGHQWPMSLSEKSIVLYRGEHGGRIIVMLGAVAQ